MNFFHWCTVFRKLIQQYKEKAKRNSAEQSKNDSKLDLEAVLTGSFTRPVSLVSCNGRMYLKLTVTSEEYPRNQELSV